MITEKDLQEAIAECEGQKNPNANTCIKLAAFYTIKDYLYGDGMERTSYSYAMPPDTQGGKIHYESETEFSQAISGMNVDDVLKIIDELMTTIQAINPRLYAGVMRKIAK